MMAGAGGATRARGWRATATGFNNGGEGGSYGIARCADGEAVDSDEQARSTCGVLDRRQQLVRRCVWQWTVAGSRRRWFVGADRMGGEDSAPRRRG